MLRVLLPAPSRCGLGRCVMCYKQGDPDNASIAGSQCHLLSIEWSKSRALQVSLPSFRMGLPAYYVIATSEASANLARFDGVRFGPRHEARLPSQRLTGHRLTRASACSACHMHSWEPALHE